MCVKNYPPEIMQPSSSTRATIVSAKIKMVQPSSRPHFSFAIIISYGNQITPAKHEGNLEMKVQNPDESQEDRAVIYEWYKAKTFCCAFFAAAMLTPSCGSPQCTCGM